MTPAEKILLALDAQDCWAPRRAPATRRVKVEPLVVRGGGATFGTILGEETVDELKDLINLWTERMASMEAYWGSVSPTWMNKDSTGYIDWTNDWTILKARYQKALSAAQSVWLVAQPEYGDLMKAMRQCYPPDGCPTVKGDWADLFNRLIVMATALGLPMPKDAPPQPVAVDTDLEVFKATTNIDLGAQLSGAQVAGPLPKGALGIPNALSWLGKHKTLLLVTGVLVVGGVVLSYVSPMLAVFARSAKGLAHLVPAAAV